MPCATTPPQQHGAQTLQGHSPSRAARPSVPLEPRIGSERLEHVGPAAAHAERELVAGEPERLAGENELDGGDERVGHATLAGVVVLIGPLIDRAPCLRTS